MRLRPSLACLLVFLISQAGLLAEGNEPVERSFLTPAKNQNKQSPAPTTQQPTAADRSYLCSHTRAISSQ